MSEQEILHGGRGSRHLEAMDSAYLADKAVMAIQVRLWSGTKSIGDEELQSLGIHDPKEFRKNHTPGAKFLVSKKRLSEIAKRKGALWSGICEISTTFFTQNLRLVREAYVDEMVAQVKAGEESLNEAVSDFLNSHYDAELESYVTRTQREMPMLSRSEILGGYPSKEDVRRRHKVAFALIRTPRNREISEEVNKYCRAKMDEEVREIIETTSQAMRQMLANTVDSFRAVVEGKSGEEKVNQRTVRRLDNALERFLRMAPSFGDSSVAATITECRQKLLSVQDWTKESVEASDLDGSIERVRLAVSDLSVIEEEKSMFLMSMMMEDVPEWEGDSATMSTYSPSAVFVGADSEDY